MPDSGPISIEVERLHAPSHPLPEYSTHSSEGILLESLSVVIDFGPRAHCLSTNILYLIISVPVRVELICHAIGTAERMQKVLTHVHASSCYFVVDSYERCFRIMIETL